jgi:hypothetical protein
MSPKSPLTQLTFWRKCDVAKISFDPTDIPANIAMQIKKTRLTTTNQEKLGQSRDVAVGDLLLFSRDLVPRPRLGQWIRLGHCGCQ